ncbi:MAG: hypothetical protein JXQ29_05080 [Planctomycetes bacterium]|nr:hypothetical protein [Planctomycetota bacterium]
MNLGRKLREIVARDPRFKVDAYEFVFRALDYTMERLDRRNRPDEESRHISGPELLEGIREYAVQQFGYLARFVFERWGVRTTEDFGEIVFNLVDDELLRKRPEDTREDFRGVYDLAQALDRAALEGISWEGGS